jgi:Ca2+-binding EF-hand superfamily protein
VDELYVAVRKVGAEVELNDIIDLMSELDVDRNGQLDIDEFIALMNVGSQLQFRSQGN